METDEDHTAMRGSFLLVRSIPFIEYTNVFPAHVQEDMVEKLWKADAIWFGFFDSVLWRELVVSLQSNLNPGLTKISSFREKNKKKYN